MLFSRTWMRVSLCVIGLCVVWTAHADVRNPVRIRIMTEGLKPARTGEKYSGVLELTAPRDGVLERIEIGGEGWQAQEIALAAPVELWAGQPVEVPFETLVLDAEKKLEVRTIFNGELTRKRFSLDEKHVSRIGLPRPVIRVAPTEGAAAPSGEPQGGIAGCDDRLIRVRGRFEYVRPDGQVIGADGLHFRIMDEDTGPDELMFESYTDTNGYFDVTICWDDCDVSGCDDPDIYIHFDCETGVAIVRDDDAGEDTYAWSTEDSQLFADYGGSDLDFGNIRPANAGDYPAVHIHNSTMRAHRFVLETNGYYTPQVEVVWQDGNGAFYSPSNSEIHIGPDEQWNEGTQVHEWGHHLLFDWTDPLDPDYCNGFCDATPSVCGADACSGGGGHCLWCAETDHDAWNEGFPDWLGSVVMRGWQGRYGGPPPMAISDGRYTHEVLQNCCDGTAHNALWTEGFVAALLHDIEDPVQDAGQTGCPQDALSLGPDEILAVVRQARPIRVMEFISAFRTALGPNFEYDFRSTAMAISLDYVTGWNLPALAIGATSGCGAYHVGETIQLTVASNASPLSTCMRWQRDGVDVTDDARTSGATTNILTITNAAAGDAGRYTLRIATCDGLPPNQCNGSHSRTSPPISVRIIADSPGHRITGWGRNLNGSLGRGYTMPDSDVNPGDVINLTNVAAVSAGYWNSIAALTDGTAWVWGFRYLGNGTLDSSATPVQVNFISDIVAVAAGSPEGNCLALDANGRVWSWGSNYQGLLGYSSPSGFALNPGQVSLDCVVDIAMGNYHAAVITSDGSLWMWGTNFQRRAGTGIHGRQFESAVACNGSHRRG
ncbi:MAG: hypothetical protein IPM64_08885 [Phycisphaerales bacterium]|nr:hypothetical protein [Phycisphaerales bacterium]